MKLIDIDKLIEDFRNTITENSDTFDWLNMISRQPTAYDVDKVVERLEGALLNLTFHKDDNSKTWNRAIHKAIEIVKSGGIE